eukprot:11192944-Lingulodinium_polyedra.AAC.1
MSPANINKHVLKVLESFHAAYELMYGASYFLSEEEARALDRHLARVGLTCQRLAVLSASAGQLMWPARA